MFQLWKLQRERSRIRARRFRINLPGPNFGEFWATKRRELEEIDRQIDDFLADSLTKEAQKYDVSIPYPDLQDLTENQITEFQRSSVFRAEIRKRIDEEKTRRRDVSAWWWKNVIIPALTALTGLAGVITGMIAVIHAKK